MSEDFRKKKAVACVRLEDLLVEGGTERGETGELDLGDKLHRLLLALAVFLGKRGLVRQLSRSSYVVDYSGGEQKGRAEGREDVQVVTDGAAVHEEAADSVGVEEGSRLSDPGDDELQVVDTTAVFLEGHTPFFSVQRVSNKHKEKSRKVGEEESMQEEIQHSLAKE